MSDFLSIIELRDLGDGGITSDLIMTEASDGTDSNASEKYGMATLASIRTCTSSALSTWTRSRSRSAARCLIVQLQLSSTTFGVG